jgi:23S rRNA (adenine2503-C2)-methyltransferase
MKSIYDKKDLEKFLEKQGYGVRELRRARRLLFREFESFESIPNGEVLAPLIEESFQTSFLKLVSRMDSKVDGATKLLFETHDGRQIETVILRIATGRTSICVSSQVGCTEKCTFCATGAMGFLRNLTYSEILDQIVIAGRILREEDRKLRNIVFMGMGEPLRNYENLEWALERLLDGSSFQFAPKFITISSSGLPDLMLKFSQRFPQVGIALSLNAADDETRVQIMPINERFPMNTLRETLEEMEEIRGSGVMIEYIMFDAINDTLEDAQKVADFLRGLDVHINLIPYNPDYSDVKGFNASKNENIVAFQALLKDEGYKVTRRFSLGQDIAAACGQLANNDG